MTKQFLAYGLLLGATSIVGACSTPPAPPAQQAGSGDAAFNALVNDIVEDQYQRNPSGATYLGIHKYDDKLDDYSAAARAAELAAAKSFKSRLEDVRPETLTLDLRLDRDLLIHEMDATMLQDGVVKRWEKDADAYQGAATNSVYTIMKRDYAPAADRLKFVIAREKLMPGLLAEAKKNLQNPPKIFTQIAIEQVDGNQSFFKNDLPLAFAGVTDNALQAEFKTTNAAVIKALADYKVWLKKDLLPRSTGEFALGAEVYSKVLSATEMVDMPLDALLKIAEADLQKNAAALVATAKLIDAKKSVTQVIAEVQANHPKPSELLKTTQDMLDQLRQFLIDKKIVTIPASDPAHVQETPPFMRATTSASMDTPGPFETKATQVYYNMTLPEPTWKKADQDDFMRQWYYAAISNVSVHEVYPGHYLQFLNAKSFPTLTRKVFGANSNSEGWAHYAEQMMLDEGFHANEPAYRIGQLQDALLRDVRFIVGIKMHTQGMTIDEATKLFSEQAYEPIAVAQSEAKRGAGDPFYGYYTMGKLAIMKLRDDYKSKLGAEYSLQKFHDEFIKVGPLPLPLVREKMLGARGSMF